jgi:hypothetical protein
MEVSGKLHAPVMPPLQKEPRCPLDRGLAVPHIVRVEFNGLPNNVIHTLGFCGEDGGIIKLNVGSWVDIVFSYG